MLRSPGRPLVAGLLLVAALVGFGRAAAPVAAQTGPLFPAGVLVMPVAGGVGVAAPPVVVTVPALGVGTPRAQIDKERSRSRERADVTIGGA